jgi:hypothetical protein
LLITTWPFEASCLGDHWLPVLVARGSSLTSGLVSADNGPVAQIAGQISTFISGQVTGHLYLQSPTTFTKAIISTGGALP